jgi:hypothetical protein
LSDLFAPVSPPIRDNPYFVFLLFVAIALGPLPATSSKQIFSLTGPFSRPFPHVLLKADISGLNTEY